MGILELTEEQERIKELLLIPGLNRTEQEFLKNLYQWRKSKWTSKQKDFLESIEYRINALRNPPSATDPVEMAIKVQKIESSIIEPRKPNGEPFDEVEPSSTQAEQDAYDAETVRMILGKQ